LSKAPFTKNDLSIATLFKIGELNLLFGGDVENQTLNQIPDFHFEDISFIKTPHHTSKSSIDVLNKLDRNDQGIKIPSVATTIFSNFDLPDLDVIKEYLLHAEVFNSTGEGSEDYGTIMVVFDILGKAIETEELRGNAIKL